MFESVPTAGAVEAVARFRDAVDGLLGLALTQLSGGELLEVVQAVEVQVRRLASVDHGLVAELDSRGLAAEHGCASTRALLRQVLRIGVGKATARVGAAADLGPRRDLGGSALEPLFARVAEAQAAGSISPTHARIVTSMIDRLPEPVAAEDLGVEAFLVEQATVFDPETLAKVARRLADTLDPDGTLADERYRERGRALDVQVRRDGSALMRGELTATGAEVLLTVLDATARPHSQTKDGMPDPRTAAQRRHDGLLDALLLVLRAGQLPQTNGVSTTVLLTMSEEQLRAHAAGRPGGLVPTGHATLLSLDEALRLACDARVLPVVFGTAQHVSAYGSSHRLFTEGQRLAMIARDVGCSFPGCDVPALWCQAHHVTEWAVGRRTSIDNGTLVCGFHHREHPKLGWRCRMIDGIPHWIPPAWLDPARTPRRNTAHCPAAELPSPARADRTLLTAQSRREPSQATVGAAPDRLWFACRARTGRCPPVRFRTTVRPSIARFAGVRSAQRAGAGSRPRDDALWGRRRRRRAGPSPDARLRRRDPHARRRRGR